MKRFLVFVVLGASVTSGCVSRGPSMADVRARCERSYPDQIGAHDERPFPEYMDRCIEAAKDNEYLRD